ncbi:zf-HC2 domain-containing protein [Kitasatospora sp. GP82]|uniref:zf-HC2 domain-containing protein n=1 Tax=Kitasatospora sp. GP82 TaxID=3035089 RepID=UPI002475800F|nr:zf-HC2 domain-containing protein [Kitasatospora sp. GP82]MDH6123252.1 anti-sigma factor (TIGR02949 family) [Kitasatospora sp. GP82]
MSGANPSGAGRSPVPGPDPAGRLRRGTGWAQLGRRGEQERRAPEGAELRAVAVKAAEPPAEEHHLGDRLSAFLDGELGHDARERVQAHLATCADCLAEADEGRAVKQLLTRTVTPAPSSMLMSRLLAVAALPDDEPGAGPGAGSGTGSASGEVAASGTIGGSRLTGGSFGRGAGSSFGGGALGAGTPLPGVDPRAGRSGFLRRSPAASGLPQLPVPAPLAAMVEPVVVRPVRGRRFVFAAAAGAFSVAAVTLGSVSVVPGGDGGQQHGSAVTPARGTGDQVLPMTAQQPVDFSVYPVRAAHGAGTVPQAPYGGQSQLTSSFRQNYPR